LDFRQKLPQRIEAIAQYRLIKQITSTVRLIIIWFPMVGESKKTTGPNTTQTTGCHSGEIRLHSARGLAAR